MWLPHNPKFSGAPQHETIHVRNNRAYSERASSHIIKSA